VTVREHIGRRSVARLPLLAALVAATFALPVSPAHAAGTGDVVAMVNAERESAGCSPVSVDDRLAAAARGHSRYQAEIDEMTHEGADDSTSGDRATDAGYRWSSIAENIAYGTTSARRVMDMWMGSSGHRANIVNCTFRHIGVAQVDGRWTQVFGKPRG
jgi:uncharacterized protein YkwD